MTKPRRYEEVLDEDLKDPGEAARYLSACLEDGDAEVFLLALRDVARARGGVGHLAEVTELSREHLYRILSEHGNPELGSLERLLDALGLRLAVAVKSPPEVAVQPMPSCRLGRELDVKATGVIYLRIVPMTPVGPAIVNPI